MRLVEAFLQDARYGVRALLKSPGFTLAALLTVALGIGANAAIFSAVNAILLEPLPYAQPERRVMIWSRWQDFDKTWLSAAEVLDYRARSKTMAAVAAWASGPANLTGDGEPVRVGAARVTANTFDALGARPLLGQSFTAADEPDGRNNSVVVIGFGLWQRRYGGNPDILGKTILVNGTPRQVLGVMPRGFQLPTDYGEDAAEPSELWSPLLLNPQNRGSHGLYGAAVLNAGATPGQASEELKAIAAALTREGQYPPQMRFTAFAVPLDEEILGGVRPAVLLLFGAVAFLLLIACANVANLLLARAEARHREIAVRSALGAGQWRILRQLFTESLVLAAASTMLGLGLASTGIRTLTAMGPIGIPRAGEVAIDSRVLVFASLLALATTFVFSVVPAWRLARLDLTESLKEGGQHGTVGGRRQRFRALLVVAEMAFAVVLLIGAGLMIRSLSVLQRIDIGFDPNNLLTMRLTTPPTTYDTPEKVLLFYRQLLDRVRSLPGVRHAGLVRSLPLGSTIGDWGLDVEGFVETPGNNAKGDWQVVSDGAAEAMGERLVAGRWIGANDTAGSMLVAVVNETLAKRYWATGNPGNAIGGRIKMGNPTRPWITVVGVVRDVKHNGLTGLVKEKFYVPHSQFHLASGSPAVATMYLAVRTSGDPMQLAGPIRAEVRRLDRNLPISDVRLMSEVVTSSIATARFTGFLLALFAALALTLSAIGIYGVLSYLVSQRTHEIGIRLAIGAGGGQILRMVLGHGLALSLIGVVVGLVAAVGLTQLMTGLLYQVRPLDPLTFAAVPVTLALVALVASYVPALRATRVDPLTALRTE